MENIFDLVFLLDTDIPFLKSDSCHNDRKGLSGLSYRQMPAKFQIKITYAFETNASAGIFVRMTTQGRSLG
ncbi:hypothetical protein DTO013E5_7258 [Penicillium roqueforti]|uniref:uncharacterized protein n=1 Tax=Penicillium roqueforti TaxID=5082 RepID=UPI00190CE2F7|nr:uncharacterized protein LCP9604111_5368 [Penicillium roqueforti]KAF9248618.1 hypothetical protein LCP9604111_5368 [Penicillium roqueforti]KAI1832245.1 hypothetical protein CBS147337_6925 [Penicillium roqueforti]KAI2670995.1 hypothetical protein LCP963914a_9754 [Penicillium roqueforti]KAI2671004.1 hypothetical protein CBS147355_8861 [Penicillium roqueforti]KAI2724964.1 hypothetical protein CBS147354_5281 [Penicillium roqueforti]